MFYFCSIAWWNTSLILITKFCAAPYLNCHRTLDPWVRSSLRSCVSCPLFVVMWTPCLRKRRLLFFLMTLFLRLVKSVIIKKSLDNTYRYVVFPVLWYLLSVVTILHMQSNLGRGSYFRSCSKNIKPKLCLLSSPGNNMIRYRLCGQDLNPSRDIRCSLHHAA